MMRCFSSLVVVATCLSLAPAMAQDTGGEPSEDAKRFGARQSILDISLSPSGDKIAFIGPGPQGSETLNVIDLTGDASIAPIMNNSEQRTDLSNCDWATDERLVCEVVGVSDASSTLIGYSRMLSIGADGSAPMLLTPRMDSRALGIRQDGGSVLSLDVAGEDNRVLMTKQYVPERTIGTRLANELIGLGIEEVDITNGRRKKVENPDDGAIGYIADDAGEVRLKIRQPPDTLGNTGNRQFYYFRARDSRKWQLLSEVEVDAQTRSGYVPVAVDAKRNIAYGFGGKNGYDAIVEMPLAEGAQGRVIMARDDVDVDRLIRIGRQRRVVGASYATEKRAVEYFDEELAAFAKQMSAALPGQPLVDIVGASADESKLLIVASSDTDPGMVYLYDKASKQLSELLALREPLVGAAMGTMKPVSFPAADGTQIPGYLTLPPGSNGKDLPSIVLPHGGPSARDEWGFDWLVQFFTARGYAVLQPNYRGSAGYGSAWFGRNGFQAWKTAIGDVNDAGRWMVSHGIARPDKLAIVGWSYGGYAALQSQVADPALYKAVVAIAPVTDLELLRDNSRRYTSYALVDKFIGRGDHVAAGSPSRHADSFTAPVMLFHGTLDQNVDVSHARLMASRLKSGGKRVEYLEFDGLDHSLSDSTARAQMLHRIDGFLTANLAK